MIRRVVHRRGLAVIALLASLAAAVWVVGTPPVELGPGTVSGPAALAWRDGATAKVPASIRNEGAGDVLVREVVAAGRATEELLRVTGSTLRPTLLEPGDEVALTLHTAFGDCRWFAPGSSATLDGFRVRIDDGQTARVGLRRGVRVVAPRTCPGR
jgi:hypothetical protein